MNKRVAVVTGGTGGIGTAICQQLSKQSQVVACYYKGGHHLLAQQWQQKQKEDGYQVDLAYGNLANFEDCKAIVDKVMDSYGRLDILIHNAGVTKDSSLKNMTPEKWKDVMEANLTSVYNLTYHALPHMINASSGRVLAISSINGRKGQFGQCNYAATKAALFHPGTLKPKCWQICAQMS